MQPKRHVDALQGLGAEVLEAKGGAPAQKPATVRLQRICPPVAMSHRCLAVTTDMPIERFGEAC